jgi:hypothetical protein
MRFNFLNGLAHLGTGLFMICFAFRTFPEQRTSWDSLLFLGMFCAGVFVFRAGMLEAQVSSEERKASLEEQENG